MPGSEKVIDADAVIIAFGFNASPEPWFAEFGIEINDRGLVEATPHGLYPFQTKNEKVFAAGDMVRGADLVVTAIADARKAGKGLVDYVTGRIPLSQPKPWTYDDGAAFSCAVATARIRECRSR